MGYPSSPFFHTLYFGDLIRKTQYKDLFLEVGDRGHIGGRIYL